MTIHAITPTIRDQAHAYTEAIADRFSDVGLESDTLDRLREALGLDSPLAAQTAANELELVMGTGNLFPDDNLAKLRYLLAEGSPVLEEHDFAQPAEPVGDLHNLAAMRAANAWLARRSPEGTS